MYSFASSRRAIGQSEHAERMLRALLSVVAMALVCIARSAKAELSPNGR
jgi:hypothetical protein